RPRPLRPGCRRLVHGLARPNAEEDAAGVQALERAEGLGDDRRRVSHRRREHARAEARPIGPLPEGAEPGQGGRAVAAVVPPGLEVIRDAYELEPCLLGEPRVVEQLAWPELLRRGLVAERQHLPLWSGPVSLTGSYPAAARGRPACRRRRQGLGGRRFAGRGRARSQRLRAPRRWPALRSTSSAPRAVAWRPRSCRRRERAR